MLGNSWKITKNLAGVVQNFIKILRFDSRRVGISPLNQGNMGGWWDLSKQFQRYPIGDETLGMFSNFLDIAILQKSSISSRYICIINIPIYIYNYISHYITVYIYISFRLTMNHTWCQQLVAFTSLKTRWNHLANPDRKPFRAPLAAVSSLEVAISGASTQCSSDTQQKPWPVGHMRLVVGVICSGWLGLKVQKVPPFFGQCHREWSTLHVERPLLFEANKKTDTGQIWTISCPETKREPAQF